jgi:predicted nuclease of predicted toxin-antitoxin system
MQFKIDENLPIEIAELLIDAGYDAKTVYDYIFSDQALLSAL